MDACESSKGEQHSNQRGASSNNLRKRGSVTLSDPQSNDIFPDSEDAPIDEEDLERRELAETSLDDRFHFKGHIPRESPCYDDIEEAATQPERESFEYLHRHGNTSMPSEEDECDVLCILHPVSPTAYWAVEFMAALTPQHVLQNQNLSHIAKNDKDSIIETNTRLETASSRGSMFHDTSIESKPQDAFESDGRAMDIALRLSSKLNDPCLGFIFGRSQSRSDIIIGVQDDVKISNRHFRIYVNASGILVIEDTSTNGTSVDSVNLYANTKLHPGADQSRMITGGSMISVLKGNKTSDLEHSMRFIVSIPSRDRVGDLWAKKLQTYIDHISQARHKQAVFAESSQKNADTVVLPPMGANARQALRLNVKPSLALIGEREANSRRKEWNGGENYNMLDFLGHGGFARVYKLATKRGGDVFALKQIDKRKHFINGILNPKIKDEIHIMKGLNHPHVVKLFRHEETPQHLCLILEFIPFGDLGTSISSGCALPELPCQRMAWQIGSALDYLHKRKITHRDIKPENILVESHEPLNVKLSDFGLSKKILNDKARLQTFCGSVPYCAPEIYAGYDQYKDGKRIKRRHSFMKTQPYQQSVDIWSFAAVLYHVLCLCPPYEGTMATMLETIMTNEVDFGKLRTAGVSYEGIDFVSAMLKRDPLARATDAQCLQHPWLAQMAVSELHNPETVNATSPSPAAVENQDEFQSSQLSQLSLIKTSKVSEIADSDAETDLDDIADTHQPKRLKYNHDEKVESQ